MNRLITSITLLFTIGYILTGCDTTNPGLEETGSVQLQVAVNTSNSSTTQSLASQKLASEHQEGLVIEEVRLFVSEMELESVENDSIDFEVENFIVNLPLDGSPLMLTEREVPAGIYEEFELDIEKPDSDIVVNNSDFQDETGAYSVVVKGLYNGEEFMFRTSEDFELELDLIPHLVINDGGNSVLIISIWVDSWFLGPNGEDLNPKDPANTVRIIENIDRSFEAYEDQFDDDDD